MLIIGFIVVFEKYDHHTRQPFQSPLLGTNNSWEPIFKSGVEVIWYLQININLYEPDFVQPIYTYQYLVYVSILIFELGNLT